MSELQETAPSSPRRRSGRIIALTVLMSVIATLGFAAAADSFAFQVRGGDNSGTALKCPGGMSRLSQPFDEGFTTVFPGDPAVMVEIVNTIPVDYFLLEKVTTGTHGGTHLDAPRHFIETGRSVDQLDATEFVWPAYVIDVRDRVAAEGPDFQLTEQDIKSYENTFGRIKNGSMVIIHTGHEDLFGQPAYNDIAHPGFSADAVAWMIDKRSIAGLGSDGLGPDASNDADFAATYTILDADGVALAGLNNLDSLNAKGDIIIASAVPLVGGSGYQVDPLACHGAPQPNKNHDWNNDDDDDDQGDDD